MAHELIDRDALLAEVRDYWRKQVDNDSIYQYGAIEAKYMIELAPTAQSGWISVKDRLPDETGSYLVFYHEWSDGAFLPTYDDRTIRVMWFLNSRKWCFPVCVDKRCEADTHREVTHWMPLPEPPKEDGNDAKA